jgi:probable HAF family extracellular repeat protein
MKRRRFTWKFALVGVVTTALVIAVPATSAHAAPTVAITDLGAPGNGCCGSAVAINAWGQIAGGNSAESVLWTFGQPHVLSQRGRLTALNDFGTVVGTSPVPGSGTTVAVRWVNGQTQPLMPDLGKYSVAQDVNDLGVVLIDYTKHSTMPFVTDTAAVSQAGVVTDLPLPGNPGWVQSFAINTLGQAVGLAGAVVAGNAFAWSCLLGSCTKLPTLGTDNAAAIAVNTVGQIAGDVWVGINVHAVRWTAGQITDLGTLGGTRSNVTQGHQTINLLGDVIGESDTAQGQTHAFLSHAGKMIDLGTLGGDFSVPYAVNRPARRSRHRTRCSGKFIDTKGNRRPAIVGRRFACPATEIRRCRSAAGPPRTSGRAASCRPPRSGELRRPSAAG